MLLVTYFKRSPFDSVSKMTKIISSTCLGGSLRSVSRDLSFYKQVISLNQAAIYFADQVTISAIGPSVVVINVLLGWYVLKEIVNWKTFIACFFLIAGSIISVVFSNFVKHEYNIFEIEKLFLWFLPLFLIFGNYTLMIVSIMISSSIIKNNESVLKTTKRE